MSMIMLSKHSPQGIHVRNRNASVRFSNIDPPWFRFLICAVGIVQCTAFFVAVNPVDPPPTVEYRLTS